MKIFNLNKKNSQENFENGQALLTVIVAMTVALAIVTSIALRNLATNSRITSTDTSSRVGDAAEGGAERFLTLPVSTLSALAACNESGCAAGVYTPLCTGAAATLYTPSPVDSRYPNGACQVTFTPTAGDNVTSRANVVVNTWPTGAGNYIDVNIKQDQTFEINLNGYAGTSVVLCWTAPAHLYSYAYTQTAGANSVVKRFMCNFTGCPANLSGANLATVAPSNASCTSGSFNSQATLTPGAVAGSGYPVGPYGVRLLAVGGDVKVRVVPVAGSLPTQGYMITSYGELSQNSTIVANKQVVVTKSLPFLPGLFNFEMYTGGVLP